MTAGTGTVAPASTPSRDASRSCDDHSSGAETGEIEAGHPGKWWLVGCFAITLAVYLAVIPRTIRFNSPPTGDQPYYLLVTDSLVTDGDLELSNNFAERDEDKFYSLAPHPDDFVGFSAPYPLPFHAADSSARPDEENYSFHHPGLSVFIAPAWMLGSVWDLWWPATIVFMSVMAALLATNVFLLAWEVGKQLWIAVAVWGAMAFANPLMTYSQLIFAELVTALVTIYAFRRLAMGWDKNGLARHVIIGIGIAALPWLSWRCLMVAIPLTVYALVQWRRARRSSAETRDANVYLFLAPIALSVVGLAIYHNFLFGSLLPPVWIPELPEENPFTWPWSGLEGLRTFATRGLGHLFDVQYGLFVYAPIYVLAIVGAVRGIRSQVRGHRRLLACMAGVVGAYLFVITAFDLWHGTWNPPARFLTVIVPLLAAPLAMGLRALRHVAYKVVFGVLAVLGLLVSAVFVSDPAEVWPWSAGTLFNWLAGEDSPLKVQIVSWFPNLLVPAEGALASSLAWMLVVAMGIVVAGLAATRTEDRSGEVLTRRGLVTSSCALGVLGALWLFVSFPYM